MTATVDVWKTSVVEVPSLKESTPLWPLRSGRFPKVIEICGVFVCSSQNANTLTPNKLGFGNVVVVDPMVVVVVDGAVVLVVEDGATVVLDETTVVEVVGEVVEVLVPGPVVLVVLDDVVVVPVSGGGHSLTSGSSWPTSYSST